MQIIIDLSSSQGRNSAVHRFTLTESRSRASNFRLQHCSPFISCSPPAANMNCGKLQVLAAYFPVYLGNGWIVRDHKKIDLSEQRALLPKLEQVVPILSLSVAVICRLPSTDLTHTFVKM